MMSLYYFWQKNIDLQICLLLNNSQQLVRSQPMEAVDSQ